MKRDGFVRRGRERGGGEVGSGGQGGLLSCQAENLGVANTLLLTHCMRIGNLPHMSGQFQLADYPSACER